MCWFNGRRCRFRRVHGINWTSLRINSLLLTLKTRWHSEEVLLGNLLPRCTRMGKKKKKSECRRLLLNGELESSKKVLKRVMCARHKDSDERWWGTKIWPNILERNAPELVVNDLGKGAILLGRNWHHCCQISFYFVTTYLPFLLLHCLVLLEF